MAAVDVDVVLVAGTGNLPLARRIAAQLGKPLGQTFIERFADGELSILIREPLTDRHVFVITSLGPPAHEHLLECCLLIDAARKSGAKEVTAVISYFAYARQDKQSQLGEPISAGVVARCLEASGISRLITLDVHSENLKRHFTKPVIELSAVDVLAHAVRQEHLSDPVIVAPDIGACARARQFAAILKRPVVMGKKRRDIVVKDTIRSLVLEDTIEGNSAIIVDDMISTGGTIERVAMLLASQGIEHIFVCATHFLGLEKAKEILGNPPITGSIVTDSLPMREPVQHTRVVSVDAILAKAIASVVS